MRYLSAAIFVLGAGVAACASPTKTSAISPTPVESEVVATVNSFFAALRTRDTAALHALIAPDLVIVASVAPPPGQTGPVVRRQTGASFLTAIVTSKVELRERMWSPEVRVDGAIAIVWAPYDFHRGTEFSHCGHDTFQLAREKGKWVVTALAYTVQPSGCPPAPAL